MTSAKAPAPRIGIDLGGTKIEGVVLRPDGSLAARHRVPTPRIDYAATLDAIGDMVRELEIQAGLAPMLKVAVGIGMPGSTSPVTGLTQGASSTWLNGRPIRADLEALLARPVRTANDANCFALSEAVDGAGAGARSVFGAILGTGCGGGLVFGGQIVDGPNAIGGEWGHNPLPWPRADEHPGPTCWCGRSGCMEMWVSGTGLAADHLRCTGQAIPAEDIVANAYAGDADARATLDRHADRLGRGIAHVVNIFDPAVIVLGGGLSKLEHLYAEVPALAAVYVFAAEPRLDIRPPRWGDAGGVRGAAWLW